jgi:hypothetical protein
MKGKRLLTMLLVLDISQELLRDGQPSESHFMMAELALSEIVRNVEKLCCKDVEEILFGEKLSTSS